MKAFVAIFLTKVYQKASQHKDVYNDLIATVCRHFNCFITRRLSLFFINVRENISCIKFIYLRAMITFVMENN